MATLDREQIWLEQLRSAGYRLTNPRKAVVKVVSASPQALNAADVLAQAQPLCRSLGMVTVYRTLEKLAELALIERVHQSDGCHAYIAVGGEHQHVLVCESCGQVAHFGGDDLNALIEQVSQGSGFEIHAHWLQLTGLCAACKHS